MIMLQCKLDINFKPKSIAGGPRFRGVQFKGPRFREVKKVENHCSKTNIFGSHKALVSFWRPKWVITWPPSLPKQN